MRQIYNRSFTVTFTTGDSGYVFTDPIDPGMVLHVHNLFAYAPEREANDDIVIGIRDGGQDIILQAQATAAVQLGAAVANHFVIGEGDKLFAYFPDADNTDKIGIHVTGELMPLTEWARGSE